MSDLIRVKRGLKADLPELMQGEFGFCTDTGELFIGGVNGNVAVKRQNEINVKDFGAVGDGVTNDTAAIQSAFDAAALLYGGDVTATAGYIGFFKPEIAFPTGTYLCGTITTNDHLKIKAYGQAVIQSLLGTSALPAGTWINNAVTQFEVEGLTFLYFDTAFIIPTNNADFSFITFENCRVAKTNTFVDTVGYTESRSTTFKMSRCHASYGVKTLCKVYTDKSSFEGNWFTHDQNTTYMVLDSLAYFRGNMWVPLNTGASKAYISFTASDTARGLTFESERFGAEDGSCPIVIVGNVNTPNTGNEAYRQQGISFIDCVLTSNATYNPDGITGVRGCVILRPTLAPVNSINFISFQNCAFLPNLSGGIVQTYNVGDITTLMPTDFVIDFDYASIISATKGINKPVGDNLLTYVNQPNLIRKTSGFTKTGKLTVVATATAGQKKGSFKINRVYPTTYTPPFTYLVVCIGQGDSSFSNYAYGYTSTYLLTIAGKNAATTYSEIKTTKLHGDVGGASLGANADIISAHFGTGDTGSATLDLVDDGGDIDVTIAFGTRVQVGSLYVIPLFDFSLLT